MISPFLLSYKWLLELWVKSQTDNPVLYFLSSPLKRFGQGLSSFMHNITLYSTFVLDSGTDRIIPTYTLNFVCKGYKKLLNSE